MTLIELINEAVSLKVDLHASRTVSILLSDGHSYSVRSIKDLRAYDFHYLDDENKEAINDAG